MRIFLRLLVPGGTLASAAACNPREFAARVPFAAYQSDGRRV
jgi:hypothetical protein